LQPQSVASGLTSSAIFPVVTLSTADGATGFRSVTGKFPCIVRIGSDAWNLATASDAAKAEIEQEAARHIAFAADGASFDGYAAGASVGIREAVDNAAIKLPMPVTDCPEAVARAVSRLRPAGVEGTNALVLGQDAYTAASSGNEEGYPVYEHLERLVDGRIIRTPGIVGGLVLSTGDGDFEREIGQDFSICYDSHTDSAATLYIQESFTFRPLTAEAAVSLEPGANQARKRQ
jgi:uncharacterized linocin/CFP29 family protein